MTRINIRVVGEAGKNGSYNYINVNFCTFAPVFVTPVTSSSL